MITPTIIHEAMVRHSCRYSWYWLEMVKDLELPMESLLHNIHNISKGYPLTLENLDSYCSTFQIRHILYELYGQWGSDRLKPFIEEFPEYAHIYADKDKWVMYGIDTEIPIGKYEGWTIAQVLKKNAKWFWEQLCEEDTWICDENDMQEALAYTREVDPDYDLNKNDYYAYKYFHPEDYKLNLTEIQDYKDK